MPLIESIKDILKDAIFRLDLNMNGTVVLTEAATGHFFVTPILAAISGAKVIAVAKDSKFGMADDAINWVKKHAQIFGVEKEISYIKSLSPEEINKADIITNLGFLRPLDKSFLSNIKKTAVISLFCETWEVRKEDVDLDFCYSQKIPIMGTNEDAKIINVFSNVGPLILKMIEQTDFEIHQKNILIISADKFGKVISETLNNKNVFTKLLNPRISNSYNINLDKLNAIIIADYSFEDEILGKNGIISISNLKKFKEIQIIHLAGKVDAQFLKEQRIKCYPDKNGQPFKMSKNFSFLGIKPVVDLHAAGLKVGEELLKSTKKHKDFNLILEKAMKNPICQPVNFNEQ